MTDGVAELRPIQCVEMEVPNAARVELPAKLRRDRCSDQLARRGKIVEPFEQAVQPIRNARAAGPGEAARLRDIRDRKNSRHDLDVHARSRDGILETKETIRREEELRNRPVRPGVDLALEIVEVRLPGAGVRM